MGTYGLHPKLPLTPEYIAFLERTVCAPAFRAAVPDPKRGAVTYFHLDRSLALSRCGAGLEFCVENVRGWPPDGRPVAVEPGEPVRCAVTSGADGDYHLSLRLDPPPAEGTVRAPRYALSAHRTSDVPAPAPGVLDLGTIRVKSGRASGFARYPAVSAFGAVGPWDDEWRAWVAPVSKKVERLIESVEELAGARSRTFGAAVLELARVWSELPVHDLVARVRWLGRERKEPAGALALPRAEPPFVLPDDPHKWPEAVADELDAALPVKLRDDPLIPEIPNRPDPVHERAEVQFTPDGTRLRVDFLTEIKGRVALELRLAGEGPAQLTYEYGRGSGSATTDRESRPRGAGYALPAPPRDPNRDPKAPHPPLFVWSVPECELQLLVTAR